MPIEFPVLNVAALYPEIIVIATAFVVMAVDMFVGDKRIVGYVGLLGLIAAAGVSVSMLSAPAAPAFQDMAMSDGYSLVLNLIFIVTAGLSILLSLGYLEGREMQRGEYYALILFSTSGMMFMGAATDLIIVFLGLEIMSIALYILAAFNRKQLRSGEAGMKYFVLGAFASAFFLYGVALIYGSTGTTNLLGISEWFDSGQGSLNDPLALVGLALLIVGFGFKVAAVPFQWWTPDVYQGAPTSVTAFMSVGAKAAGFAALIRLLAISFDTAFVVNWQIIVAILAVITMTGGNVAALAQKDVKRMLAYSSIAHAGYILVGVAAGERAVSGILFYLMAYAFMNIGAFAVIAVLERQDEAGSQLSDYTGLAARTPLLALVMAFFMFSLTGIPPFVGFWGKLYVFQAAVEVNMSWLAIVGMINSAISAFYYLGVVVQMYMRTTEEAADLPPVRLAMPVTLTLALAGIITLLLGVWPTPLVNLTALGIFG